MEGPGSFEDALLEGLTPEHQQQAVKSNARRLLVIAGAGSGKTEVMARRVAWWLAIDQVPKDHIVAFTFTEAAAEELKFRIRARIQRITAAEEDPTLGGMYVGTIHGFCLKLLRELAPEIYYTFDILDEAGRMALVQRGYHGVLGLSRFREELVEGQFESIAQFLRGYDLLNEYDELDVELGSGTPPADVASEREWVSQAVLRTNVGNTDVASAFGVSAARFYAYMRARRFLDFSTSQSELTRLLRARPDLLSLVHESWTHTVVDEVQDINPVQDSIIKLLVGDQGRLTAVGDHRQAIFAFRGGRVDLMEALHAELQAAEDGDVIELPSNFRSTPRVIQLANQWSQTIEGLGTLPNPEMMWGNTDRFDYHDDHTALHRFEERDTEAEWIAGTIGRMVRAHENSGVRHDDRESDRGLSYSDIAILIRSATDVGTYQDVLRRHGIPSVVRAGPDLFSQPEILLFVALLAEASGVDEFLGNPTRHGTLPARIASTLGCRPRPSEIVGAACRVLRDRGLPLEENAAERLTMLARAINNRIDQGGPPPFDFSQLRCREARNWVRRAGRPRRVFPQQLYHWLIEEAQVYRWDAAGLDAQSNMFHLGQLSRLITSIETPGWTTTRDFRYQIIALTMWGTSKARTEQMPLLVAPDAVTITTVHSAKGLQFGAVFLADVNARRFPSNQARRIETLPFAGEILERIDPRHLADTDNLDNERRLMYVALTRAERYLFVSCSGRQRSRFVRELAGISADIGAPIWDELLDVPESFEWSSQRVSTNQPLATNFSDLRYYLECPHDFYLRKVLGFAPTIDPAFGYGRGVHNILREIHRDPRRWAELARNREILEQVLQRMVESGLFYLRYTTGVPLGNMRAVAVQGLTDYIQFYVQELERLEFEPEREFETLIPDQDLLISGTIDLLRLDDPPRVTIVDFKSGEHGEKNQSGLAEEMMRLQIGIYGLATRHELEYEPDRGIIRYIGEQDAARRELDVGLGESDLQSARETVVESGNQIRARRFNAGPAEHLPGRCTSCDFARFCSLHNSAGD